ncbi:MAG: PAS domain S-box protein, partial [Alphaproteobacteria bacterium]|nr:PAS domain S-box protein [Alphaproteobacteria bacterium]
MNALRDLRLVTLIFVLTCAPVGAVATHGEGGTHRVLAIHSYSQDYQWTSGQHSSFIQTLENGLPNAPTVKTEYLDTKRKALDDTYAEEFVSHLRVKYQEFSPDAIYVTDDNALNFSIGPLANLYPNVPIFFSGVNDFGHLGHIDPNRVTGVFEEKEILPNLEFLRQTFSQGNRITVVGDGSVTYRAIEERLNKEIGGQGNLELDFIVSDRLSSIQTALRKNRHFPVLLTTLGAIRGDDGNVLGLDKIISGIVQSGSQIILSMEDVYIVGGVLGGYVTSSLAQGSSAANLLLKYFSGIPLSDLSPITRSPNEYVLDDRVLESLNADLPTKIKASARFLNPRGSFYDLYKKPILGSLALLCVALIVSAFLYLISLRVKNRLLRDQRLLLEESEARFRGIFEHTTIPSAVADMDGRIVEVNGAYCAMLGYTREELLRMTTFDVIHPDDIDASLNGHQRLTNGRAKELTREKRYIRKDGSTVWGIMSVAGLPDESGRPTLTIRQIEDITERRRVEEALRESEELYRSTFRVSPDAININRLSDGLYLDVNEGFTKLTGLAREEVVGRTSSELGIWANPGNRERMVAGIRDHGLVENLETTFCRKDGSLMTALMSARAISLDGEPHLIAVTRDISELRQTEALLHQAQKMETVGQLTGGVAHDFNNLLQVVETSLELAKEKIPKGSEAEKLVDGALRAGHRGAELTQQLLAFSRKQTLNPENLDARSLVDGMTTLFSRTLGEDISIETKFADGIANVLVDESGLTNALLNLALNARAAMPKGGTLSVAISKLHFDTDMPIENDVLPVGDYVEISVSDTGCGISEENLSHAFEPFFTTRDVGEGRGLGLSMVYGFARQAGGNAAIESELGKG